MTASVVPRTTTAARARPRLTLVAAAALVLLWTVHLTASWVGGYERVPWDTLEHEQTRMSAVTVVAVGPLPPGPWWTVTEPGARLDDVSAGQAGRVVYTVRDGQRVRVADPSYGAFGLPSWTQGSGSGLAASDLPPVLERGLPPVGTIDVPAAWRVSEVTGWVLALGTLLLVVAGPRPVHGNRWFWFWVVQLPVGLGVLAYAVCELGGRGRARAVAAPEDREGGGWGFIRLISGYVVIGVLGSVLTMLLGVTVTPL